MKVRFTAWNWSGYSIRAELKRLPKRGSHIRPWMHETRPRITKDGRLTNRIKSGRKKPYIVAGRNKTPLGDPDEWVIYTEPPDLVERLKDYYDQYAND